MPDIVLVLQRVVPSRDFSEAFSKNSFLGLCHLPIKPDPLNPLKPLKLHVHPSISRRRPPPGQMWKFRETRQTSAGKLTGSSGISVFDLEGAAGEISKTKTLHAGLGRLEAPNQEKDVIFRFRGSSLIGRCQNLKNQFFENAMLMMLWVAQSYAMGSTILCYGGWRLPVIAQYSQAKLLNEQSL